MARQFWATLILVFCVFAVSADLAQAADEIRGIIGNVDTDKNTITLKFPALPGATLVAPQTFEIPKEASVVDLAGKDMAGRLKDKRVKEGVQATITLAKKGGKVTKVKIHVDPDKK